MSSDGGSSSNGATDRRAEWRGKVIATLEQLHERIGEQRAENRKEHDAIRKEMAEFRADYHRSETQTRRDIAVLQLKAGVVGGLAGMIPATIGVLLVVLKVIS